MRARWIVLMVMLFAGVTGAFAQKGEEAAVRAPLENYIKGHATGNGEFFRKAFYPDAKLWFVREGKLTAVPIDEFIARAGSGKPAADESRRKRSIERVDIFGDAAIGKIVLDYPDAQIVDYMTLLKVNGEWKIINKSFHAERRTQAASAAK